MSEQATATDSLEVAELEIERLPLSDNPPKKIKLNANHKKFIKARLSGKSNIDAYIEAYGIAEEKRDYARMAASRLMMTNDSVREEIDSRIDESVEEAQATFSLAMSAAASIIVEIAQGGTKEDGNRLRAAEYITDRGLGKPRTDLNVDGSMRNVMTITFDFGDSISEDDI